MRTAPDNSEELKEQIIKLEARLENLQKRLPAHSIPPAMIAELDEIDEKLEEARARLAAYEVSED